MDGGILLWVVVGVVVVAALVVALLWARSRRRRTQMREWFGPEYDRAVDQHDKRRHAERDLQDRMERHESIELRPLSPAARQHFQTEWRRIQEVFVDRPRSAVDQADELVTTMLRERGYPVDDFDERAELVSVDHPRVVEHYRKAQEIRDRSERTTVSTEELREAMVCYRTLFGEALADGATDEPSSHSDPTRSADTPDTHRRESA